MEFKKIDHVEISAGDTLIFSTSKCPISEEEAMKENITIDFESENTTVPCCVCDFGIGDGDVCPYFNSFIKSEKGEFVNCCHKDFKK